MSKFIVVGDVHVKDTGKLIDGLSESLYYAKRNLLYSYDLAVKNNADIVLLGDIFSNKKYLFQEGIMVMRDILNEISKDKKVIIVVGNHDFIYKEKQISWLYSFNSENIIVTKENEVLYYNDVAFIGYHDKDRLSELVKEACMNTDIIMSHFGLDEGVLSNNHKIKGEFSIRDFDIFTDEKIFILGHYHKPQTFKRNKNFFYYVGSVQPDKIDEIFDEKRIILFDTDNRNIEEYETFRSKWKEIIIEDEDDIESKLDIAKEIIDDGNKVYLICKIIPTRSIVSFYQENSYNCYLKVDLRKNVDNNDNNTDGSNITGTDIRMINLKSIIEEYCKSYNIYDEDVINYIFQ